MENVVNWCLNESCWAAHFAFSVCKFGWCSNVFECVLIFDALANWAWKIKVVSRRFQWECLIEYTTKFDAHTHTSIWIHDQQVKLKWMCQFEWENTLFQSECETTIIKILNTCCCYSDENKQHSNQWNWILYKQRNAMFKF